MAVPKSDKHKEYFKRFAPRIVLTTASAAKDQKTRAIQREMVAEWLNLADFWPCIPQKGTATIEGDLCLLTLDSGPAAVQ